MASVDTQLKKFWDRFHLISNARPIVGLGISRGESRDYEYPCEPSLFRHFKSGKYGVNISLYDLEEELLENFKRQAIPLISNGDTLPATTLEWMSLAQHYGLATRLVDWTTNPLVALYFAVEKNDDSDGYLYYHQNIELFEYNFSESIEFNHGEMTIDNQPYKLYQNTILEHINWPFTEGTIYDLPIIFHRPKYTDARYRNQSTVLACPAHSDFDIENIWNERITIPAMIKPFLRSYLRKVGITSSFIYPGLSGVAANVHSELVDWNMTFEVG